jgi:hypothetical protein
LTSFFAFLPPISGVLAAPPPTTPDIAIGKPSQFRSGLQVYDSPAYGNDGNITTAMRSDTGLNEFWYVDLENTYNVSWIRVLGNSLAPFCIYLFHFHNEFIFIFDSFKDIFLKNGPIPTGWPLPIGEILADPTIQVITQDNTALSTFDFPVNFAASSLMIVVQGSNYLTFNEFEVYGIINSLPQYNFFLTSILGTLIAPTTPNIALDKPSAFVSGQEAYDSPVYGNDGDVTTVMHSDSGLNQWWYVDLAGTYNVTWVTVIGSSLAPFCIFFIFK